MVDGRPYPVLTDFRVWMAWGESVEVNEIAETSIWDGIVPDGDWVRPALDFYLCESVTPKRVADKSGVRPYDLVRDGDYIVGSFQSAYGIDLTDSHLEMHWHRFMALLRSLPSDAKLSEIMVYRSYHKGNEKPDAAYQKLKGIWTLPPKRTAKGDRMVDWQMKAFGNIKMEGRDNG